MPRVADSRAPVNASVNASPARGRCQRCGELVIGCRDSQGRLVPVHPVAVPGGELIINGDLARIVQVLSHREASAAHRRGDLGFMPHSRVCNGPHRDWRSRR